MSQITPMQDTCLQCNSPDYEPGFKVRLCRPCRTRFSSYPVSKKVIAGGIILGLIVAFSLFRSCWDIKAAYYYEKGLVHFNDREYTAAIQAFVRTDRIYRNHTGSAVHLLTAKYYSILPEEKLQYSLDRLEKTSYQKDPALYEEAETIKNRIIRDHAQAHNMDTAMKYYAAQKIPQADSLFEAVMMSCPGYLPSYIMHAKCLRKQHQYAAASKVCDKALAYNHQLSAALREKDTIQTLINTPSL
jgi:tetratricopeptide (TPR) repeat protein